MRENMTKSVHARLVIGGKLTGFSGYHPRILEEAWMSLKNTQPLFLVEAFGGAARAVIDVVERRKRDEFTEGFAKTNVPNYEGATTHYQMHGEIFISRETLCRDIETASQRGIATALNNGLDHNENRELFRSTDPARIAELVLMGLSGQK